jgi:hypothetical protein
MDFKPLDAGYCGRILGHCWTPIPLVATDPPNITYSDPEREHCKHCRATRNRTWEVEEPDRVTASGSGEEK